MSFLSIMFDQEIFDELCSLIEKGGEVWESAMKVAKKYKTTSSRLVKWFYERNPHLKHHRNRALSEEQEEQLIYAMIAMSHVNLDWSVKQLVDAVKTMFGFKISLQTGYRFMEQHKDVFSFQVSMSLGKKRTGEGIYDAAMTFADRYEQFLLKKKLSPCAIVNYDECRIVLNDNSIIQVKRLVSKKKNKPQHVAKVKGRHCGTFLPFVGVNRELLASYFILPAKFDEKGGGTAQLTLPSTFSRTRKGMPPPLLFFNETGYLNTAIFDQILDHFTSVWEQCHPGLHCCLIGDNLAAHRDLKILQKALDHGIYMTFLVEGTTHWSQPLDNLLFASLKQEIG